MPAKKPQLPPSKPSKAPITTPSRSALDSNTSSTAPTGSPSSPLFSSPLVRTSPRGTSSPPRRFSGLFMSSPVMGISNLPPVYETTAERARRLKREKEEKERAGMIENETSEEKAERGKRERAEKKRKAKDRRERREEKLRREREERIKNETPEEKVEREKAEERARKRQLKREETRRELGADFYPDDDEGSDVEPLPKRVKTNKNGMGMGMGKPTKGRKEQRRKKIDYGSAGSSDADEPIAKAPRKTLQPKSVKKKGGKKGGNTEGKKNGSDSGSEFGGTDVKAIQEALSLSDQSGDESDLGSDDGVGKSSRQSAPARPMGTRRNPARGAKKSPVVIDDSEPEEEPQKCDEPEPKTKMKPEDKKPESMSSPPAKGGKRKCQQPTADGNPCGISPQNDSHYCHVHNKKRAKEGKH